MNKISAQLFSALISISFLVIPACAEEGTWKQYFDIGIQTLHYKEIAAKLEKSPKSADDASFDSTMYAISSRDTIKKSAKYLRGVITIFRKGDANLPTKQELSDLCGALALVWRDELKEAQEQNLGKPRALKLKAIRNVQFKMRQDNSVLLELSKKVCGEQDPDYIKLKNAGERLEKSIRDNS